MQQRILSKVALVLLFAGLAGCSGSTATTGGGPVSCSDPGAFCVQTCNLGCGPSGGCSLNEIAVNQPLQFVFSRAVDPRTVDFTTMSLKTRAGQEPTGQWFADGQTVTFLPEVQTIQGQTFFGFVPNEEYILTIRGAGGGQNTLRSTGGSPLAQTFTCTLRASLGIVDLNQAPPTATLVNPTSTMNVPRDINIVLEFSEFIDGSTFFDPPAGQEPIQYVLQEATTGGLCAGRPIQLTGTPRLTNDVVRGKSIVSFTPVQRLPGNRCVKVIVTSRVHDLAGTPAIEKTFELFLENAAVEEHSVDFDFANDLNIDLPRSGGTFSGGSASFVELGGDGRHGDLEVTDGMSIGSGLYEFDTDLTTLSQKDTSYLNGPVAVSDGNFYFTNFVIPAGTTLRFKGSKPARIFVRGTCRIDGKLSVTPAPVPQPSATGFVAKTAQLPYAGQPGVAGGAGGGDGGDGAWACDGTGNPNQPTYNNFNGYPGEDVQVPAGHAYAAQTGGTGGRGGHLFPANGNQNSLTYAATLPVVQETAAGAGGGGFITAGSAGRIVEAGSTVFGSANTNPAQMGPPGAGGSAFALLPLPSGTQSSDHFLVGGAGGGGGASHALFASQNILNDPVKFRSGAAGAGGGGALLLRVGRDLFVGPTGTLAARGGTTEPLTSSLVSSWSNIGAPAPGGAGSGGSLLLQVIGTLQQSGTLDARGGDEIAMDSRTLGIYHVATFGGAGGAGFVRLERPASQSPAVAQLGTVLPTAGTDNVGVLAEGDDHVGFMTKFTATGEVLPPRYRRYEITADVDGAPVTFSDDPAVGTAALEGSSPLIFWIQAIDVDSVTGLPAEGATPDPWRRYVGDFGGPGDPGIVLDGRTGFRWQLILDRTMSQNVVVHEVKIIYES